MVNSIYIAGQVMEAFPENKRPETTEGYEGFFHLNDIKGSTEETVLNYIIRDHDRDKFEEMKDFLKQEFLTCLKSMVVGLALQSKTPTTI